MTGVIRSYRTLADGTSIEYRPGTLDELVLDEVFVHDHYKLGQIAEHIAGGVVVDVGANIGCVTRRCLDLGARWVLAIEPEADNRLLLLANTANCGGATIVYTVAVGDPTVAEYVAMHGTSGDARSVNLDRAIDTLVYGGNNPPIPVWDFATIISRVTSLLEHGERIGLLKVDVEGAEYDWFDTATPELLAYVNRIHMEWHATDAETYGQLLSKLAWTHSVSVFGRPDTGGMLFAHPYA